MQSFSFRPIMISAIFLFTISCNNSKKQKKPKEDTPSATIAPPPPPETACYANDGLKYKTVITVHYNIHTVTGDVTSEDMGTGTKETVAFEGKMKDDKINITFKGDAPVIGDASEWTDKQWKIVNTEGSKKLLILFKAKNYETNKWEETEYEFSKINCN